MAGAGCLNFLTVDRIGRCAHDRMAANRRSMNPLLEFLEFIEAAPTPRVHDLLDRVLFKSRTLTGAEAGTIFMVRRAGRPLNRPRTHAENDRCSSTTSRWSYCC